MTPQDPEVLRDRGRGLEDEFFRREDQRLIARLNELKKAETTREALAKASGITQPAVLDTLMSLGIRAETVAALSIVPLVEVAWADGSLDAKERGAILERARQSGMVPGSSEHALLEAWLERRPDAKLLTAWTHLVRGIRDQVGPDEATRLKTSLLEHARAVASASGGVLGFGAKVSQAEAAMLARLESAFAPGP
jgi:tellurite resistance protein